MNAIPTTPEASVGLKPQAVRLSRSIVHTLLAALLRTSFASVRTITSRSAVAKLLAQPLSYNLRCYPGGKITSLSREVLGSWSSTTGLRVGGLPGLAVGSVEHGCWQALQLLGERATQQRAWLIVRELRRFDHKGKPTTRVSYLLVSGHQVLEAA